MEKANERCRVCHAGWKKLGYAVKRWPCQYIGVQERMTECMGMVGCWWQKKKKKKTEEGKYAHKGLRMVTLPREWKVKLLDLMLYGCCWRVGGWRWCQHGGGRPYPVFTSFTSSLCPRECVWHSPLVSSERISQTDFSFQPSNFPILPFQPQRGACGYSFRCFYLHCTKGNYYFLVYFGQPVRMKGKRTFKSFVIKISFIQLTLIKIIIISNLLIFKSSINSIAIGIYGKDSHYFYQKRSAILKQ